jgi:hypothetical protein
MWQGCRPAGRLFYLALAVMVSASSFSASAHGGVSPAEGPAGKSPPTAKPTAEATPRAASPSPQSGPSLTSVIDATAYGMDMPGMLSLALTKAYELKLCLTVVASKTDSADPNLTTLNDVLASLT